MPLAGSPVTEAPVIETPVTETPRNGERPDSDGAAEPGTTTWSRRPLVTDMAAVAALTAVLAFLWGRGRGVWFWIDEAIAVGISSQPLSSIPELLRQDAAPPLYYVVLHGWMALFGSTEASTHTLSLLFALAVVPAALWAGWSLFGRRTGWIFALLASLNPFIAYYANETRMYSLVILLGLLAVATFLHAFVFGRRRHLLAFAVLLSLLLYTHNWSLFFGVGAAVAVIPCALTRPDRRRTIVDAALAFGAVAVLYAPWLPTLLYQSAQEGNPWSRRATITDMRDHLATLVGGTEVVVLLGIGAFAALATILRRPRSRTALAVVAMAIMVVVVMAGGWVTGVWAYRYLAIVVPPLLLVLAIGLARGGTLAVTAIAVTAFLAAPIGVKVPPNQKSNAKAVAEETGPRLAPGDLVVSGDYTMVPLLAYYLPPGLSYAGPDGLVPDDFVTDWRHGLERVRNSRPGEALPPLIDELRPGGRVLVMCRHIAPAPDTVEFHLLAQQRCTEIARIVQSDQRLRLEQSVEAPPGIKLIGFDALLLTKVDPQ